MQKKITFVLGWLLVLVLLLGCQRTELDTKKQRWDTFKSMEEPIIVYAEGEKIKTTEIAEQAIEVSLGSIILIDKNGTLTYFTDEEIFGVALMQSYDKGDTLISQAQDHDLSILLETLNDSTTTE